MMDDRAIAAWFRLFAWAPADPAWPQRRKAIWAWRKYKKARRWARVLALVPSVRMIAIGNDLGYGNCSNKSDIDLVIVTAPRRVWLVRLCVVSLLRLFRQRPGEHKRDAICPSFFLTTEAMNLEPLQLSCHPEEAQADEGSHTAHGQCEISPSGRNDDGELPPDPYLLFWITQLTVLYDVDGTYDAFWRVNERWARRWLPDARPRAAHPRLCCHCEEPSDEAIPSQYTSGRDCHGPMAIGPRNDRGGELGGRFGDAIEHWCRRFQERRLSSKIRVLANRDTRVIITDRMLKFHTNDRRAEYRDRWIARLHT